MQKTTKVMLPKNNIVNEQMKSNALKTRLIWIYVLNIFDLIATTVWISLFGLHVEANPLARWMYETNVVYLVKTAFVGYMLHFLNRLIPKYPKLNWMTWMLLGVYALIAAYHLFLAIRIIFIFVGI